MACKEKISNSADPKIISELTVEAGVSPIVFGRVLPRLFSA